ncbi:hypothetical protein GCM10009605_62660 [Nocardiopsis composta]
MAWYGLWYGGPGYSPSSQEDMEEFSSLQAAKEALRSRMRDGYSWRQEFRFVFRDPEKLLTPAVSEESYIDLYSVPDADLSCIERRILFGPRGGVLIERG